MNNTGYHTDKKGNDCSTIKAKSVSYITFHRK